MTGPGTPLSSAAVQGAGPQRHGRALVIAMNAAIRAVRLYPIENAAVQKAIIELGNATERVIDADGQCELRSVGDQFFVNDTRLRLAFDNYAAVASLLALFRNAGLGGLSIPVPPPSRAWVVLLSFLHAPPADTPVEDRAERLRERLAQADIAAFELFDLSEVADREEVEPSARERARRTYARSIEVTREVLTSARLGRSQGLRQAKRAVQGIVDMIMTDSASLLGMTTLRDFDEYTFVHSVNVCILSVALGRRLGLTKTQLLDLGLASLLHDIGKARIPLEVLNKQEPLTEDEVALMRTHTWHGVLALFSLPTGALRPWRAMITAYEHHMRIDHSGYPTVVRPRTLNFYSKIIAVADAFDAATTERVYRDAVWTPHDALRGMRDNPRLGLDPSLVKAFINLVGIYPMGSLVVLDSYELAVVIAPNPDPTALSRPLVQIIMDDRGNFVDQPDLLDLTEQDESGQYVRSVLRTEDPERYAIQLGDYFA
ncbi:MAG: HD domain-containing protein [Gemmatimonadaceae bacterium]|nr:HD domain-containing protein [Gemmatimonadaceae bacterium]